MSLVLAVIVFVLDDSFSTGYCIGKSPLVVVVVVGDRPVNDLSFAPYSFVDCFEFIVHVGALSVSLPSSKLSGIEAF